MKNKIVRTYSKKKEYIKLKNDRFEKTLGKQNVSDKSVTGQYNFLFILFKFFKTTFLIGKFKILIYSIIVMTTLQFYRIVC